MDLTRTLLGEHSPHSRTHQEVDRPLCMTDTLDLVEYADGWRV